MPQIVSFEEAFARVIPRENRLRVPFFNASALHPQQPYAFMNRAEPGHPDDIHYHTADQWQIVSRGKAIIGREQADQYCLHFNRAYTPYNLSAVGGAMDYFDLYTRYQHGGLELEGPQRAQNLAGLKQVKDRNPWQIKRHVELPSQQGTGVPTQIVLEAVPDIQDDNGLFAYTLILPPNAKVQAPDPGAGAGQYILGVTGSLRHGGRDHKAYVVVFVDPKDGPMTVEAGEAGLEAFVLNFPRTTYRRVTWVCGHCGHVYDEAESMKRDDNVVGKRWKDLPWSWTCPDCSAPKAEFNMVVAD